MTTSQAYQADDDQLVQAHDQAVPEDNLMEPATDVSGPVASQSEPEADLMAPDAALPESGLDPVVPDADRTANEDPASHPVIAVAPVGPDSVTSTASDYPGFIPEARGGAEEPGMADSSSGSQSPVSATAVAAGSVTESHPAGNTASADGPWNEIQAMFVDDPHASIERAAGLVDERVDELIQSIRARQLSMQAAWQAKYAGTEELRVALQHYRTFWNSLDHLPAPA